MSFELPSITRTTDNRPAWSGMAVLVEAMVLLVFAVASLAVITQLFAASAIRAREGEDLAQAVALATTTAERFAAHPDQELLDTTAGRLVCSCEVNADDTTEGTLYHATITVNYAASDADEPPVYVLNTSRYQREVS